MSLTHDPFGSLRLFEDAVTRMMSEPRTSRPWSPAVDIVETEDELIVKPICRMCGWKISMSGGK
jgi:HSP20 family molecular chaperone IbpA